MIGAALDNLADAAVYGVSLYVVGRMAGIKVRAARLSGERARLAQPLYDDAAVEVR